MPWIQRTSAAFGCALAVEHCGLRVRHRIHLIAVAGQLAAQQAGAAADIDHPLHAEIAGELTVEGEVVPDSMVGVE